jgi:hypothetical protein
MFEMAVAIKVQRNQMSVFMTKSKRRFFLITTYKGGGPHRRNLRKPIEITMQQLGLRQSTSNLR